MEVADWYHRGSTSYKVRVCRSCDAEFAFRINAMASAKRTVIDSQRNKLLNEDDADAVLEHLYALNRKSREAADG